MAKIQSNDRFGFINNPPQTPVTSAAIGRIMAKPRLISENVAKMESMPVCGVAMRNEAMAPFEAFSFLRPIAVGITPHEHSGRGTPNSAAHSTDNLLFRER